MPSSSSRPILDAITDRNAPSLTRAADDLARGILATSLVLWFGIWLAYNPGELRPHSERGCEDPAWLMDRSEELTVVWCSTGSMAGQGTTLAGSAGLLFGRPIDLNVAEVQDLVVIPGIGPARAKAIIDERDGRPFHSLHDLERVQGIGARTRAKMRGWVRVGDR